MNYIISLAINTFLFCIFFDAFSMENRLDLIKEIIKKSHFNREPVAQITSSPNGQYFLENVSTKLRESQVHLYKTSNIHPFKTFDGYNVGTFAPTSNYILIDHTIAPDYPITMTPCLYSIAYDTLTPLVDEHDKNEYKKHICSINHTGKYIAQELTKNHTSSAITEKRLFRYNSARNNLTKISLDAWGTIWRWALCDKNGEQDSESSMIYLNDQKQLIKRSLDSNQVVLCYVINENYPELSMNGPIISLLYNTTAALLLMQNNTIEKIHNIEYPQFEYITNTLSMPQGLICIQTDRLSCDILDSEQNTIGSFTLADNKESAGYLDSLIIDSTGKNLVALHNFTDLTPSKIIFFDLSQIQNNMHGTEIFPNYMRIKSITFINDKLLLMQGTETIIFNISSSELIHLGESQASTLLNNSLLLSYHTPFTSAVTANYSEEVPATTTISRYNIGLLIK